MHKLLPVARKVFLFIVLLLLPGGLIALASAYLATRLARTRRGRRWLARAHARVERFPRLAKPLATARDFAAAAPQPS